MHYFAQGMRVSYDYISRVPKFLLMIFTGAFGSVIMRLLHRPPPETAQPTKPVKRVAPAKTTPNVPAAPSPKKTPAKGKKGGKK